MLNYAAYEYTVYKNSIYMVSHHEVLYARRTASDHPTSVVQ